MAAESPSTSMPQAAQAFFFETETQNGITARMVNTIEAVASISISLAKRAVKQPTPIAPGRLLTVRTREKIEISSILLHLGHRSVDIRFYLRRTVYSVMSIYPPDVARQVEASTAIFRLSFYRNNQAKTRAAL